MMTSPLTTADIDRNFVAWLTSIIEDEDLDRMSAASVVNDLTTHREMLAYRTADYMPDAFEDGMPEFMLIVRSAPNCPIEMDDDYLELVKWSDIVGVRITPCFYPNVSGALSQQH